MLAVYVRDTLLTTTSVSLELFIWLSLSSYHSMYTLTVNVLDPIGTILDMVLPA